MNTKVIFVLSILAGLASVYMVNRHVDNLRGETITVFKTTADFKAGEIIGSEVAEVTIPSGLFPKLLEDAPTSDLRNLVETTELRENVTAGEILLFRHFDSSVDDGLTPEIPPGKKAISIAVSEDSAVSFFIKPGDLVDVLATFMGGKEEADSRQNSELSNISTRPIVQAVRVLAVGDHYRKSDRQTREPYSSVTLLVSMEEAAKLIFARDFSGVNMTLVLRGENDTSVEKQMPEVGIETLNFDSIGNIPTTAPAH